MDPTLIGTMAMGASAGGSALSTFGALFSGDASAKGYKYQAGVAKLNADIQRQNAEYTIRAGEQEASRTGRKYGQIIGQQKARQAAKGLDVNRGAPAMVRDSQHDIALEDQGQIRENANRKARGQLQDANKYDAEAAAAKVAGRNSRIASYISAGSSILGGVSSVSSKWLQGQSAGLWGGSGGHPTMLGDATYVNNRDDDYGFAYGP